MDTPTARHAPRPSHAASAALATLGLLALAGCATPGGGDHPAPASAAAPAPRVTDDQFCAAAQALVNGATVPAVNTVYSDFQAFVESKPAPRPLATRQYVWFEDEGHTQPKMVSCKMKTDDHIRVEYGADRVGADQSCALVNQRIVEGVRSSLTRAERRRVKFDGGRRVVYDADQLTTSGPGWLAPFPVLYVAPDGALHAQSKSMKNDWLDPRLANADPRVRGTRYCHLVAPEYVRRVLLGDVTP